MFSNLLVPNHSLKVSNQVEVSSDKLILTLESTGELIKLNVPDCQIDVLLGMAWVSLTNEDIVLRQYEHITIFSGQPVIISNVHKYEPLTIRLKRGTQP